MAYTYDRTSSEDKTAAGTLSEITQAKDSVTKTEAMMSKTVQKLFRLPGMAGVSGPLDQAADLLVKAKQLLQTAEDRHKDISNR